LPARSLGRALRGSGAVMERTKYWRGPLPRRVKGPVKAGSALQGALPKIALGPRLVEYRIKRQWAAIVGPALSARTEPLRLIQGTLHCAVSTSTWMTELNYQKPLILEKIKKALGAKDVKDILFKPGEIQKRQTAPGPCPPSRGRLGDEFIEKTASKIGDEALRDLVKRVMKKYPF